MSHPLLERLRHPDPAERRAACAAICEDPSAVVLAEALARALGDPDKGVARAASDALVTLARHDAGVEPILKDCLHGSSPRARFGAAFTLARLAPPHPGLLPALVEGLASPDGDRRWAAAKLLVETGRLHGEVLGLALGLVRGSESAAVRRMATFCLRELAPDRPEAAGALVEATRDDDLHVRRAAMTALAALLDPPPPVVRRLLDALESEPDPTLRGIAAVALGELGARHPDRVGREGRAKLESLRDAAQGGLRRAAEQALARLERAAGPGGAG